MSILILNNCFGSSSFLVSRGRNLVILSALADGSQNGVLQSSKEVDLGSNTDDDALGEKQKGESDTPIPIGEVQGSLTKKEEEENGDNQVEGVNPPNHKDVAGDDHAGREKQIQLADKKGVVGGSGDKPNLPAKKETSGPMIPEEEERSGSDTDGDNIPPNIGSIILKGSPNIKLNDWDDVIGRNHKPFEVVSPSLDLSRNQSNESVIEVFGKKSSSEILPLIDTNCQIKLHDNGQYCWDTVFSVKSVSTNVNFSPTPMVVEKSKISLMCNLKHDENSKDIFIPLIPTNHGYNFVKQTSSLVSETKEVYQLDINGVIKSSSAIMINQKEKIMSIVETMNYALSPLLFVLNTMRRNCGQLALEGTSRVKNSSWKPDNTGVKYIPYQNLNGTEQLEKIVNQQDRANPVIFLTRENLSSGLKMVALMKSVSFPWLITRKAGRDKKTKALIDFCFNLDPVFNFTTITVIVPDIQEAQIEYSNIKSGDFLNLTVLNGINDFILNSVDISEDIQLSDNFSSMLPLVLKGKGWEEAGLSLPQCEIPPIMGFYQSSGHEKQSVSEHLTPIQFELLRACKVLGFVNTLHDTMRALTWKERRYQALHTGSGQKQSVAVGTKMVSVFLDYSLMDCLLDDTVGANCKKILSTCYRNTVYLAFRNYYNANSLISRNNITIDGLTLFGCSSQSVVLKGSWSSVFNGLVGFDGNIQRSDGVVNCTFEISPFFEIFNSRTITPPTIQNLISNETRVIHTDNGLGYPININKNNSYLGFIDKKGVYLDVSRIQLVEVDDNNIEVETFETNLDIKTYDLFSDIKETVEVETTTSTNIEKITLGDYKEKRPYVLRDKSRNRSKARLWNNIDSYLATGKLVDVELNSDGFSCCIDTLVYIYKSINHIEDFDKYNFCKYMGIDANYYDRSISEGMDFKDLKDHIERFNYPIATIVVDDHSSIYHNQSELYNGYVPEKLVVVDLINKHVYPVEFKNIGDRKRFYFQTFHDTTGINIIRLPNIDNCTVAKLNWYCNQYFTGNMEDRFILPFVASREFDESLTYKKQLIAIRKLFRDSMSNKSI